MIARHSKKSGFSICKQLAILLPILSLTYLTACNSDKDKPAETATVVPADSTTNDTATDDEQQIVRLHPIGGERIHGPANIRDTINGRTLFRLDNNVRVSATRSNNGWIQAGILVDLTQQQFESMYIDKGTILQSEGKKLGEVLERMELNGGGVKTEGGFKGELVGYTDAGNLNPISIPEVALVEALHSTPVPHTFIGLSPFIDDFRLETSDVLGKKWQIEGLDETWVNDPSPMLRLWLVFNGDNLAGIFHSRPLSLPDFNTVSVKRGFFYSSHTLANAASNQELIDSFNTFIQQVD